MGFGIHPAFNGNATITAIGKGIGRLAGDLSHVRGDLSKALATPDAGRRMLHVGQAVVDLDRLAPSLAHYNKILVGPDAGMKLLRDATSVTRSATGDLGVMLSTGPSDDAIRGVAAILEDGAERKLRTLSSMIAHGRS